MTTYTSGFRAAHNLPPVECYDCGELATDQYRDAYGRGRSMPVCEEDGRYYATQGERVETVLDNSILVQFRGRLRYQQMVKHPVKPSAVAAIWTTNLYRYTWDNQHDTPEFKHARRVLSKLAAVYA